MQVRYNSFGMDIYDIAIANTGKRVGKRIRTIRITRGLSQTELGEKLELPADRIQKYENGQRNPKPELLKRIAEVLDVNVLALADPSVASYIHIMYALFDLEQNHGMKLKKDGPDICLSFNFRDDFYKYLEDWYEEYEGVHAELDVANSEEEKKEIIEQYLDWERNYPKSLENQYSKEERKKRLQEKIEELQKELNKLESANET